MNRDRGDAVRDAVMAHAHEIISMITLANMIADAIEAAQSWQPEESMAEWVRKAADGYQADVTAKAYREELERRSREEKKFTYDPFTGEWDR